MTIDAMDKWNAVAEQYYARQYTKDAGVWAALMREAWDGISEDIYEQHELEDMRDDEENGLIPPLYSVTISWSGPMFNTMDGGDYHYGTDTFYSDSAQAITDYVAACLITYKLDGFQSAEAVYNKSGIEVEMKDIIVPWKDDQ